MSDPGSVDAQDALRHQVHPRAPGCAAPQSPPRHASRCCSGLAAPSGAGAPQGAQAAAKLKVSCEQLYEEIDKTAARLVEEYNAKGSSIDFYGSFQRCYKEGKRTRRGGGYMVDDYPIPGEPNQEVTDYYYRWVQVVTRTKKGKLRSTISDFRCAKNTVDGPGGPC